jgi:hypothetical protein
MAPCRPAVTRSKRLTAMALLKLQAIRPKAASRLFIGIRSSFSYAFPNP